MKVFIAGTSSQKENVTKNPPLYVLESFFTIQDWQVKEIPRYRMFLLDSGAFTFMNSMKNKKNIDFDSYLEKYIDFINKNNIEYFFELDIDSIVGYEKVKELRKRLERRTCRKCIPVWHPNRGLEEWKKMCDEYDYVAIGGLLTDNITMKEFIRRLPWFINEANKRGAKVHGLGFTRKNSKELGFYSVDSTSWLSGARYGGVQYFNGSMMKRVTAPVGKKSGDYSKRNEYSLKEWIKYQKYIDED